MVKANCNLCGKEFTDTHSGRKSLKFCSREHFREYKGKHGQWNTGKKWEDFYSSETLVKMRERISAKGKDHFLYNTKRKDLLLRNLLDNPEFSEERKQEIKDRVKAEGFEKVVSELLQKMEHNRKFYQRIAYEAWGKDCLKCGKTKEEMQVGVHHIDKNRKNNNPFNLCVLCNACHKLLENNPEECKLLLKQA